MNQYLVVCPECMHVNDKLCLLLPLGHGAQTCGWLVRQLDMANVYNHILI